MEDGDSSSVVAAEVSGGTVDTGGTIGTVDTVGTTSPTVDPMGTTTDPGGGGGGGGATILSKFSGGFEFDEEVPGCEKARDCRVLI